MTLSKTANMTKLVNRYITTVVYSWWSEQRSTATDRKTMHEWLNVRFAVRKESSSVCKQQLTYQYFLHTILSYMVEQIHYHARLNNLSCVRIRWETLSLSPTWNAWWRTAERIPKRFRVREHCRIALHHVSAQRKTTKHLQMRCVLPYRHAR